MPRVSLRRMLVLVALMAVAVASLTYASELWQVSVAAMVMLAFGGAAIVALIDRGERQAFAIGMTLVMACYAVIVVNGGRDRGGGNLELNQYTGRLPTTRILRYVHNLIDRSFYADENGKLLPRSGAAGGIYHEVPDRDNFVPIGHLWWALSLGYCGGVFARWVYLRRLRERDPLASDRA